ncbi:serine/threonine-protein phosphatase PGAM5, mitochondrial-like [Homarus americanus]|uniref:serine/threonine-protein phosphatase PGAM5, mitochondrial-like n=1 Tax=Homarus americanus TaxID=6706 RepID=UPI001C482CA0|nr:serine/threonine-protein phosphatase PGAM5, mitochondrial-like [Homarus americanus]
MAYMKKLFRVRAVMAAAGAIAGYIVTGDERNKTVLAALTPINTSSVKWDSNWDRRAAQSLAKPSKSKIDCNNNRVKDIPEETLEKDGPTSTRHLIFVRHGQFHLQAATDADKYLTKLGR